MLITPIKIFYQKSWQKTPLRRRSSWYQYNKMTVLTPEGEQALPGEGRLTSGLCGAGIKPFGLETMRDLSAEKRKHNYDFEIIGTGGVVEPADIDEYLEAGAKVVMSGAGSMWEPLLAWQYNQYKL